MTLKSKIVNNHFSQAALYISFAFPLSFFLVVTAFLPHLYWPSCCAHPVSSPYLFARSKGPYRVHVFSSRSQDIEWNLIRWTEWHKRMQWEPTYSAEGQCNICDKYIPQNIKIKSLFLCSVILIFFLTLFLFLSDRSNYLLFQLLAKALSSHQQYHNSLFPPPLAPPKQPSFPHPVPLGPLRRTL